MIIPNLPNDEYHQRDEISKSQLDLIAQSPSAFMWDKNLPRVTTDAYDVGNAGHAIILEPEKWDSDYIRGATATAGTKANEKLAIDNPGKTMLGQKDYDMVLAMRESIMAEPTARMIIEGANGTEVSFLNVDEPTGVGQRCRLDIDFLSRGIIVDLKFIDKIENFSRHIHEYRYHVQDAHYKCVVATELGINVNDLTFVFIVCGKTRTGGRHPVRVFELKENAQEIGMKLRNRDMARYAECLESENWIEISEIDLPGWVKGD